jgi:pimeloyl-ACP methyl ester carboxylesterase
MMWISTRKPYSISGGIALVLVLMATPAFCFRMQRSFRFPTITMMSDSPAQTIERFPPREVFWITPEGLNMEVLATNPQALRAYSKRASKPAAEQFMAGVAQSVGKLFGRGSQGGDRASSGKATKPPILFIHGSYHSAWCFAENYIDYFSSLGHPCFSISMRGTSPTGMPPNDPGEVVRLDQLVSDVKSVLGSLKETTRELLSDAKAEVSDPIIVAHSLGGLVAMKLLEDADVRRGVSGVCLLCSVPPSGNGPMTQRFVKSRFVDSLLIVAGFVLKFATRDSSVCRKLFFDDSVDEQDVVRYMAKLKADSRVALDLRTVLDQLPSKWSTGPDGRASWLQEEGNDTGVAEDRTTRPVALVVGAEKDFIVDAEGVAETATYLGVKPVVVPDVPHDVMLGPKWQKTADVIAGWIEKNFSVSGNSASKQ